MYVSKVDLKFTDYIYLLLIYILLTYNIIIIIYILITNLEHKTNIIQNKQKAKNILKNNKETDILKIYY